MNKMNRILFSNGLDPLRTEILRTEMIGSNSIIYVLFEGVEYRLDGFTKTIVGEISEPEKIIETIIDEVKESPFSVVTETITKNVDVVEDVVEIQKPRGWHFRPVYVDTLGNVYYKGVLQPELKGTMEPSI